jgi:hypothetical protein
MPDRGRVAQAGFASLLKLGVIRFTDGKSARIEPVQFNRG